MRWDKLCETVSMLQRVAEVAEERQAYSQCAVEEAMACGIGVCMTCVLPVVGEDGEPEEPKDMRKEVVERRWAAE